MLELLKKYRQWLFPGAFLMILIGLVLIWLGLTQTVTVILDGEAHSVRTPALTVGGVLRAADISTADADRVLPSRGRWFWGGAVIRVDRAREVMVKTPEETIELTSAETIPANLLLEAEIKLYPQDRLLVNGATIDPEKPLNHKGSTLLQYQPATPIRLVINGEDEKTIYTGESTLGAALEASGIQVNPEDWTSEPLSTVITEPMAVAIQQARTVIVTLGDESVSGLTAADTVGEALVDLGLPLQNLHYSIPAEEEALPQDGEIMVVPVREDIQIVTEEIPHQVEYQEDPDTPLDQTAVVQEGQNAIFATRERIRYENGEEVWRASEETWQASEQQTEIVGSGSKVVVQTEVVEGETLEYYRKLTVWTTSYKPCIPGTDICYYGTSSGLPVEKGVIAVSYAWYSLFQGQRVYIPGYGYGVIADVCGGCVGKPWMDLGYSEENYDALHIPNAWRTVYFLTPVPSYVPTILP
jgi:resuscitation-promoting factor RpfB